MQNEQLTAAQSAGAAQIIGSAASSVTLTKTNAILRLTASKRPPNPWDVQLQVPVAFGLKKGDTLCVRFSVRAIKAQPETGEGITSVVVERGESPYTKSLDLSIPASREWKQWSVPFSAIEDVPAGKVNVNFRLGYGQQILELQNISLTNFKVSKRPSELPRTKLNYAGSEPEATWRVEANERIEKYRKSALSITVVDQKTKKPIPGAQINVEQVRHAFAFGTAVAADQLFQTGPDADKYREVIQKYFNRATIENHLKWPAWEAWGDGQGKTDGLRALNWLSEKKIPVRGHNLIWPSWRNSPPNLKELAGDKAALNRRIETHFAEVATACRGKVIEWDVINETYDNHEITDILGRDSLARWFSLTRKYEPNARLFLNDYPPLDGSDVNNAHLNHFEKMLQYLQKSGVPLGGIGFQGHFGSSVTSPTRVLSGLDRFAKFGLPIAITEFDINTDDEQLQADYTRDFLTACFSHPAVSEIITWGFWEKRHWFPKAALWRADWSLKPNGKSWVELTKKTWWTNASGRTNAAGSYTTRGFHGQHRITVSHNGKRVETIASLGSTPQAVTLAL
jgi:endo-1,4-beta-xylanase